MLRSRSITFALLPGILSAVALAQSGVITGTITDPDGGVVKDASIQFKNSASSAVVRGTSSSKGEYSIALPHGDLRSRGRHALLPVRDISTNPA